MSFFVENFFTIVLFAFGIGIFIMKKRDEQIDDLPEIFDNEEEREEANAMPEPETLSPTPPFPPRPFVSVSETVVSKPVSNPSAYRPLPQEGVRNTVSAPSPATETPPTVETESDFAIHSVEEARKAIIWGEIFNRKW